MTERIQSLDQFRGYTVAGMFLVNFIGGYASVHDVFKHHNTYNSYADTIMPHFFFAVGFAMRLLLLKGTATGAMVWRALGLILLGVVVYGLDGNYKSWAEIAALGLRGFIENSFLRSPFQALVHIGVTTLWILPVMRRRSRDLVLFATASGLLHLALSSAFWYAFLMKVRVIDGGPLGFLSWTLPTIAGALAYDAILKYGPALAAPRIATTGIAVALLGYAISCVPAMAAPPFWPPWRAPDLWTMSQRAGSLSYQVFSAGFSLMIYSSFLWFCDVRKPGLAWGVFATFGTNALAAYLIHMPVQKLVAKFAPRDSPLPWALLLCAVYFLIVWTMVRSLERRRIYLRL